MKLKLWILIVALMAILLGSFFVVEALDLPILTQPEGWLAEASAGVALLGVGLLIADVLIPAPSIPIMTALGHLYGVAGGTALNFVGAFIATIVGFAIGRQGSRLVSRFVNESDRERANQRLDKHGILAIVLTRPIPLLAETTAIVAGGSTLSWRRLTFAAAIGSIPVALTWAMVGALFST